MPPPGYDRRAALRALLAVRPDAQLSRDDLLLLEETQTPQQLDGFAQQTAAALAPPPQQAAPDMRLAQGPGARVPAGTIPDGVDPSAADLAAAGQLPTIPNLPDITAERPPAPAPVVEGPAPTSSVSRVTQNPYGTPRAEPQTAPGSPAETVRALGPAQTDRGLSLPSPDRGGTEGSLSIPGHNDRGIVIDVPGVGQTVMPWEFLRDAEGLQAYLSGVVERGTATGTTSIGEDGSLSLSPAGGDRLNSLVREYLARLRAEQAPAGTGEPRMQATVRSRGTVAGEASPENLLRLAAAFGDERLARGQHDAATLAQAAGGEAAGMALGGAQTAATTEMEARAQERAQRLQTAFQALDERIRSVSEMRVNVDEALGGFGGRMTAAIAVALGQIGSALGGGENAALALINQAVDRNLAAQRSNIENARADVGARDNALNQMRGILGDEAAAEDAARAMHLQAIGTRLTAGLSGLTGERLAAAQRLRDAVLAAAQAAQTVAQERAANSSSFDVSYQLRGGQSAVQGQIAGITGIGGQAQRQVPARPGPAPGRPVGAAPAGGRRPGAAAPSGAAPAGAAPAGDAPAAGTPARRQAMRWTPRGARLASAADATAAFNALREGRIPDPPSGTRWLTRDGVTDPSAASTFARTSQSAAAQARYQATLEGVRLWSSWVPRILEANEDFHAEATDAETRMAAARQAAGILRREVVHMMSGAAFTEAERQEYMDALPRPGEINVENLTEMWNGFANAWSTFARLWINRGTVGLNSFGLEPDTSVRLTPDMVNAIERAEAEEAARAARTASGSTRPPTLADRVLEPDRVLEAARNTAAGRLFSAGDAALDWLESRNRRGDR